MANSERKVRRTVQLRFTMPSADPTHILSFVNASKPFYEMLGGKPPFRRPIDTSSTGGR